MLFRRIGAEAADGGGKGPPEWPGDWDELLQKSPAEALGTWWEPIYDIRQVSRLVDERQEVEARDLLEESLRRFPTLAFVRLSASRLYLALGDEAEALAQAGVLLALEPDHYAAHSTMARLLLRRGEREAAERVLETGWSHMKKIIERKERSAKRAEYFALLDAEPEG
jgi:tetratricopeptide (TPR) repeat protein